MNRLFLLSLIYLLTFPKGLQAQDYKEFSISEFYLKIELDNGTLDENGSPIDHVYTPSSLEPGTYSIKITDGPGDLYEIIGTDYYIEFVGFYGFAGYGEEGILKVGSSAYTSIFYKKED